MQLSLLLWPRRNPIGEQAPWHLSTTIPLGLPRTDRDQGRCTSTPSSKHGRRGGSSGDRDLRHALLAIRVHAGMVTLPPAQQVYFEYHADVAPVGGGHPQPDQSFDGGDALVILRRANGEIAAW